MITSGALRTVDVNLNSYVRFGASGAALNPVRIDLNALHARRYGLPEPARSPSVPRNAEELNALHAKHYGGSR